MMTTRSRNGLRPPAVRSAKRRAARVDRRQQRWFWSITVFVGDQPGVATNGRGKWEEVSRRKSASRHIEREAEAGLANEPVEVGRLYRCVFTTSVGPIPPICVGQSRRTHMRDTVGSRGGRRRKVASKADTHRCRRRVGIHTQVDRRRCTHTGGSTRIGNPKLEQESMRTKLRLTMRLPPRRRLGGHFA
jgi:hypothetical protein